VFPFEAEPGILQRPKIISRLGTPICMTTLFWDFLMTSGEVDGSSGSIRRRESATTGTDYCAVVCGGSAASKDQDRLTARLSFRLAWKTRSRIAARHLKQISPIARLAL